VFGGLDLDDGAIDGAAQAAVEVRGCG